MKNWGHDFLKAKGKGGGKDSETSKPSKKKGAEDEEDAEGDAEEEVEEVEEVEEAEETAGSKRKQTDEQDGPSKKRETHKGESKSSSKDKDEEEDKKDENEEDDVADEGEDVDKGANGKANGSGKEHNNGPSKGDTVSWNWGSGQPEGKVIDVQEDTYVHHMPLNMRCKPTNSGLFLGQVSQRNVVTKFLRMEQQRIRLLS